MAKTKTALGLRKVLVKRLLWRGLDNTPKSQSKVGAWAGTMENPHASMLIHHDDGTIYIQVSRLVGGKIRCVSTSYEGRFVNAKLIAEMLYTILGREKPA